MCVSFQLLQNIDMLTGHQLDLLKAFLPERPQNPRQEDIANLVNTLKSMVRSVPECHFWALHKDLITIVQRYQDLPSNVYSRYHRSALASICDDIDLSPLDPPVSPVRNAAGRQSPPRKVRKSTADNTSDKSTSVIVSAPTVDTAPAVTCTPSCQPPTTTRGTVVNASQSSTSSTQVYMGPCQYPYVYDPNAKYMSQVPSYEAVRQHNIYQMQYPHGESAIYHPENLSVPTSDSPVMNAADLACVQQVASNMCLPKNVENVKAAMAKSADKAPA